MKRYRKNILILIFALIFIFPGIAYAEDLDLDVSIPVEVNLRGDDFPKENFTYILEGKDFEYKKEFNVSNDKPFDFNVDFINPGDVRLAPYTYTLRQVKGDNKEIVYDDSFYTIDVYVRNVIGDDNYPTGEVEVIKNVYDGDQKEKATSLGFDNIYKKGKKPIIVDKTPSPQTGDYGISIYLLIISMGLLLIISLKSLKEKYKG